MGLWSEFSMNKCIDLMLHILQAYGISTQGIHYLSQKNNKWSVLGNDSAL